MPAAPLPASSLEEARLAGSVPDDECRREEAAGRLQAVAARRR